MKKITVIVMVALMLLYSGCATIFSGGREDISFSSEPSGAKVLVNGQNEGVTPVTLAFKKGKEYTIEFVKEGFNSKTLRLSYSIGAGWLILDILSGLLGVIIDAATGNWNGFELDTYKANLEPK